MMSGRSRFAEGTGAAVLIAAFATGCWGDGAGPAAPGAEPLIAFRLAYDQAAPDRVPVEFEGRTVFVVQHPLISDPDLVDVRVGRQQQDLILDVQLTADGGERLRRATARHIGQWIAVYYDGEIVRLPVIRGVIGGERAQVYLPGPSDEAAERIAEQVGARWPSR